MMKGVNGLEVSFGDGWGVLGWEGGGCGVEL